MNEKSAKVAIVTGASRGIGAAIAGELGAQGINVAVNYVRHDKEAQDVVNMIENAGGSAFAFKANVRDADALDRLFAAVHERWGRLDILVNNAGVSGTAPLERIDDAAFDSTFAVNVKGVLFASQRAVAAFGEGGGVIINVSSKLGREPIPAHALYAASKASVDAITRVLAQELGARRIRVNAVAPGSTEAGLLLEPGLSAEMKGYLESRTALGRLGLPADVAKIVAFLASDAAGWITGQIIGVDGGLRI